MTNRTKAFAPHLLIRVDAAPFVEMPRRSWPTAPRSRKAPSRVHRTVHPPPPRRQKMASVGRRRSGRLAGRAGRRRSSGRASGHAPLALTLALARAAGSLAFIRLLRPGMGSGSQQQTALRPQGCGNLIVKGHLQTGLVGMCVKMIDT